MKGKSARSVEVKATQSEFTTTTRRLMETLLRQRLRSSVKNVTALALLRMKETGQEQNGRESNG